MSGEQKEKGVSAAVQLSRRNQQERFLLERLNKHQELSNTIRVLHAELEKQPRVFVRSTLSGPFFVGDAERVVQRKMDELGYVEQQIEEIEEAIQEADR